MARWTDSARDLACVCRVYRPPPSPGGRLRRLRMIFHQAEAHGGLVLTKVICSRYPPSRPRQVSRSLLRFSLGFKVSTTGLGEQAIIAPNSPIRHKNALFRLLHLSEGVRMPDHMPRRVSSPHAGTGTRRDQNASLMRASNARPKRKISLRRCFSNLFH